MPFKEYYGSNSDICGGHPNASQGWWSWEPANSCCRFVSDEVESCEPVGHTTDGRCGSEWNITQQRCEVPSGVPQSGSSGYGWNNAGLLIVNQHSEFFNYNPSFACRTQVPLVTDLGGGNEAWTIAGGIPNSALPGAAIITLRSECGGTRYATVQECGDENGSVVTCDSNSYWRITKGNYAGKGGVFCYHLYEAANPFTRLVRIRDSLGNTLCESSAGFNGCGGGIRIFVGCPGNLVEEVRNTGHVYNTIGGPNQTVKRTAINVVAGDWNNHQGSGGFDVYEMGTFDGVVSSKAQITLAAFREIGACYKNTLLCPTLYFESGGPPCIRECRSGLCETPYTFHLNYQGLGPLCVQEFSERLGAEATVHPYRVRTEFGEYFDSSVGSVPGYIMLRRRSWRLDKIGLEQVIGTPNRWKIWHEYSKDNGSTWSARSYIKDLFDALGPVLTIRSLAVVHAGQEGLLVIVYNYNNKWYLHVAKEDTPNVWTVSDQRFLVEGDPSLGILEYLSSREWRFLYFSMEPWSDLFNLSSDPDKMPAASPTSPGSKLMWKSCKKLADDGTGDWSVPKQVLDARTPHEYYGGGAFFDNVGRRIVALQFRHDTAGRVPSADVDNGKTFALVCKLQDDGSYDIAASEVTNITLWQGLGFGLKHGTLKRRRGDEIVFESPFGVWRCKKLADDATGAWVLET